MKSYDAVVIGGGPAGATAALLLARTGWNVAVVEKAQFPRRKVCGEFISAANLPLLREIGIGEFVNARAGPEVRRVGLYCGNTMLAADMPEAAGRFDAYGRACGREHLDSVLLARAKEAGAEVMQPWVVKQVEQSASGFVCSTASRGTPTTAQLRSRIIVAAHGSWERGALPTQVARTQPCASDLFAFKAHFRSSKLPPGTMPLVAFPGGYGGIVESGDGRASFSCCIRRDVLTQCRRDSGVPQAAEAVFAHIQANCRGVAETFVDATLDGAWLSAGPIRPGIRPFRDDGIFAIGNAAGEAHPIVAEGIGMAIQSAWLLCERLIAQRDAVLSGRGVAAVGRDYAASWRRNFARRIYAAAVFAHIAMRPTTAALATKILERAPALLTFGAELSGKAQPLCNPDLSPKIV